VKFFLFCHKFGSQIKILSIAALRLCADEEGEMDEEHGECDCDDDEDGSNIDEDGTNGRDNNNDQNTDNESEESDGELQSLQQQTEAHSIFIPREDRHNSYFDIPDVEVGLISNERRTVDRGVGVALDHEGHL
jgi:hypothetical protein